MFFMRTFSILPIKQTFFFLFFVGVIVFVTNFRIAKLYGYPH